MEILVGVLLLIATLFTPNEPKEIIFDDGEKISCENVVEENCGWTLTSCSNGQEYFCIEGFKTKKGAIK